MSLAVNPSREYFVWRHYHPREAEDPSAVWAAAWKAGGRAAMQDSGRLVQLAPLLRDLLESFEDERVERQVRASDLRALPVWDDAEEDECRVSW